MGATKRTGMYLSGTECRFTLLQTNSVDLVDIIVNKLGICLKLQP